MSTPILPNAVWLSGTNENSIPANDNSLRAEILNGLVISQVVTAQPASPGDGDIYIIPPGATGTQWSTFTLDDLTIYRSGTWYAYAPVDGVVVNISGGQLQYLGSFGWTPMTALSNPMTTAGDIIVGGVSGVPSRLAIGSNGQVLTVSGGAVAWGAGGGGGLTNWTDGINTAAPNAAIPVASLTANNAATNVDAALVPKGNGSFALASADNTTTGGNKRGRQSVDLQLSRTLNSQVTAATGSFAAGVNNTTTSGSDNSTAIGTGNTIGATSTSAAAIGQNNNVGPNAGSAVALGNAHNITARFALVAGNQNTCSGEGAFSYGQLNTSDAFYTQACGMRAHTRGMLGARAYATGQFAATGDAQERAAVIRAATTDATPTRLTSDAGAAGTGNQLVLANASAYLVRGDVVARQNSTGDCKTWEYRATIKRGANAAATAIVGAAVVTVADADAGAAAWTVGITADTTNGSLAITATGEAAKSLKWTGKIRSIEVVG